MPPHLLSLPQHPFSPALPVSSPSLLISSPFPSTSLFGAALVFSPFLVSTPRSTKRDRTESLCSVLFGLCSVLFGRRKAILFGLIGQTEWKASVRPNRIKRKALRSAKQGRMEALRSALFGRTMSREGDGGPSFGHVWSNDVGGRGTPRAGAKE